MARRRLGWIPLDVVEDVQQVARVEYTGVAETQAWNAHRKDGELRLLTGWGWIAKGGRQFRQGFKSETVCYRDAWYELCKKTSAPPVARLRVVASRRVA